ncbi:MAG: hypothetical protein EOP04_26985 [Proteobacteria bacterium]|nr:MAG: hypothetical protein EOP04_26985 [Pseudomonadota bacterium]
MKKIDSIAIRIALVIFALSVVFWLGTRQYILQLDINRYLENKARDAEKLLTQHIEELHACNGDRTCEAKYPEAQEAINKQKIEAEKKQ